MTTELDLRRTSRFVNVGDIDIHALDWGGDGTPLVMVHGSMRTGRSWNAVARRLVDGFRVVALDTRGHGDSGYSVAGNDSPTRMKDLAHVISELDLEPHYIMAHSLGCPPAALYASQHPDRVKGMVLIEPVVDVHVFWTKGETSKSAWMEKALEGRTNGWASMDDLRSRLGRNRMTRAWAPEALEDVLREETRLLPDGRVEIKWHPSSFTVEDMWNDRTSILDEAPRMVMPTMILVRDGNPQLESSLEPLARALPQGTIQVLPNLGHAMYMEDPDLMADIARRFFT